MKMRTRRFLIALIIFAALAGWWWLSRPREMRLVDVRPVAIPLSASYSKSNSDYLFVSAAYYNPPYAVISWDGTVRWHIVPPKAVLPPSCAEYSRQYNWSLSPDGRFFTAVIVQGTIQKVMMWDEGRLLGSVSLPLTTRPWRGKIETFLAKTTTLDNGQVFCWMRNAPGASIYLIEKGKIRAKGKLPALSGINPFSASWSIAPDGQALIDSYTYYRIVMKDNVLSFTPVYTTNDNVARSLVTHDGFLVNDDGAVYNGQGWVSTATGWHLLVTPFDDSFDPRHSTVMQVQSREVEFIPFHLKGIRILDPRTSEAWGPAKRKSYQFCQSTFDGRYLLAVETPGEITERTQSLLYWLWRKRLIPERLVDHKHEVHLYIYRKPGRLCASLPLIEDSGDFSVQNPRTGQWLGVWPLSLSEDGHTVRFLSTEYEGIEGYAILTYKWR